MWATPSGGGGLALGANDGFAGDYGRGLPEPSGVKPGDIAASSPSTGDSPASTMIAGISVVGMGDSFLAGAVLALGLFAGRSQATNAPVRQRIVRGGELRVGPSGDQPPYNAKDRDGHLIGLEVEQGNVLAGTLRVS